MKKCFNVCFLVALLIIFLNGCVGMMSGKICKVLPDDTVTKSFENYQINPEYNYYMTGADNYPRSILGLSKEYTLNSDLWRMVDTNPKSFSSVILSMIIRAREYTLLVYGYSIVDDQGKQIGVWYSSPATGFWVRLVDKEAKVTTPDDKQYERYDAQEGKN